MNWLYWDRGLCEDTEKVSHFQYSCIEKTQMPVILLNQIPSANFPPVGKCPSRLGCEECPTGVRCVTSRVAASSKFHLKGDTETPLLRCVCVHPLKKKWESGDYCAAVFSPKHPQ